MANSSINGASSTNNNGYVGYSQVACNVNLPSVSNLASDGNAYMQIYDMRMGVSGKDADRTIAFVIWSTGNSKLANSANFTVGAAASAGMTGYKSIGPLLINRTSTSAVRMGFWSSGMNYVYFQRDDTGQSMDIDTDTSGSTSPGTFNNSITLRSASSLVGNYDYYTVPSAMATPSATAGPTQVTLSWTAPSDNGGTAITGYYVEWSTSSTFATILGSDNTLSATTFSKTVTGLTNGTTYYFRVGAKNAVTAAISATTTNVKAQVSATPSATGNPPSIPQSLAVSQQSPQNSTGLSLGWSAPASDGGSAVTSYIVKYGTDGVNFPNSINTGSTATNLQVNNLTSSKTYYFQIAAVNANGTSQYTASSFGKTYIAGSTGYGVVKRWDASLSAWVIVI